MRRIAVLCCLLFLLIAQTPLPEDAALLQEGINQARTRRGLPALLRDPLLDEFAAQLAAEIDADCAFFDSPRQRPAAYIGTVDVLRDCGVDKTALDALALFLTWTDTGSLVYMDADWQSLGVAVTQQATGGKPLWRFVVVLGSQAPHTPPADAPRPTPPGEEEEEEEEEAEPAQDERQQAIIAALNAARTEPLVWSPSLGDAAARLLLTYREGCIFWAGDDDVFLAGVDDPVLVVRNCGANLTPEDAFTTFAAPLDPQYTALGVAVEVLPSTSQPVFRYVLVLGTDADAPTPTPSPSPTPPSGDVLHLDWSQGVYVLLDLEAISPVVDVYDLAITVDLGSLGVRVFFLRDFALDAADLRQLAPDVCIALSNLATVGAADVALPAAGCGGGLLFDNRLLRTGAAPFWADDFSVIYRYPNQPDTLLGNCIAAEKSCQISLNP